MISDRIQRPEARVLAEEEFRRFADLVASLSPEEWGRPTECTGWDVRKIALHILGSAEAQASVREFLHQFRRGLPLNKQIDSHHWVDGMNELQIRDRSHLTNDELVAALATVGPRAVKGRWRTPPPMRFLPLPFGPPVGWKPLKYLLDVGFTRDVWAHRIDVCVATGRDMFLTAGHDGRLVADIVAEWGSIRALRARPRWPRGRQVQPGRRRRESRDRRSGLRPHPVRSPSRHRRPRSSAPALNRQAATLRRPLPKGPCPSFASLAGRRPHTAVSRGRHLRGWAWPERNLPGLRSAGAHDVRPEANRARRRGGA